MANYKVYCPSYKRSDVAITHKLFDPDIFIYVVRQEESCLYKKFDMPILEIPNGAVKDIATTRNWILKNKQSDYIVTVDDDMKNIIRNTNRKNVIQSKKQIRNLIENGFRMAIDSNCSMWGLNVNSDPMSYRISMPFSFSKVILGPFTGIIDTDIRYDERLILKEDYDFFLQHLNKYRRVLRFNMYSYIVDHQKLKGGCQTYRNLNLELEQNKLLEKKWGSKLITKNKRFPNSINMVIKTKI